MKNYYWTEDSWGNNNGESLPENISDIIEQANYILDVFAEVNSYEDDSEEVGAYSEYLWEYYCKHNNLPETYHKNWQQVVILMDDDIREKLHFELAPCLPDHFLAKYLELDPDFESVLEQISADIDYY